MEWFSNQPQYMGGCFRKSHENSFAVWEGANRFRKAPLAFFYFPLLLGDDEVSSAGSSGMYATSVPWLAAGA